MMQPRFKAPRINLEEYDMAFKLLVSPHAAGKIIGRGGAEIAKLKQELGVGCHIFGLENAFPRTEHLQVAVLFGNSENLVSAFEIVVAKLVEAENDHQSPLTVPVVMTNNVVSMVIGTKGATIAGLRQESGCQFGAEKDSCKGEQLFRVTGLPENVATALALLLPFIEKGGDSKDKALQEYWGEEYAAPPSKGAPVGIPLVGKGWPPAGPPGKGIKGASKGGWLGPAAASRPLLALPGKGMAKSSWGKAPWQALPDHGWGEDYGYAAEPPLKRQAVAIGSGGHAATVTHTVVTKGGCAPAGGGGELQTGADTAEDDPQVLSSPCTIAFAIPADTIGRVLGKGGSSSSAIKRATGVHLKIEPGPEEGTVTLTGQLSQVHLAHKMVVGRALAQF